MSPEIGTEDQQRGLVWDGKDWVTRSAYRIWLLEEQERLNREHRRWLQEQGIQPKEEPSEDSE